MTVHLTTEDLLALRAGGDQGQLEPGGKRAADDGGLVRVGPAGDELPRAGGGAVVAAGGRLVTDEYAPSWWVLADADGNLACVCTWQPHA